MSDTKELVERLRRTPLYEGHGEESDSPDEAADALEVKDREIVELRGRLESECAISDRYRDRFGDEHARAEALAVKLEKAKAALRPLAEAIGEEASDPDDAKRPDNWEICHEDEEMDITLGDLRRAREALEAIDAS